MCATVELAWYTLLPPVLISLLSSDLVLGPVIEDGTNVTLGETTIWVTSILVGKRGDLVLHTDWSEQ